MFLFLEMLQVIDLIQIDLIYYNLCSYLLENVLVIENEDLVVQLVSNNIILFFKSGCFIK